MPYYPSPSSGRGGIVCFYPTCHISLRKLRYFLRTDRDRYNLFKRGDHRAAAKFLPHASVGSSRPRHSISKSPSGSWPSLMSSSCAIPASISETFQGLPTKVRHPDGPIQPYFTSRTPRRNAAAGPHGHSSPRSGRTSDHRSACPCRRGSPWHR
jgi:hypothetical protein